MGFTTKIQGNFEPTNRPNSTISRNQLSHWRLSDLGSPFPTSRCRGSILKWIPKHFLGHLPQTFLNHDSLYLSMAYGEFVPKHTPYVRVPYFLRTLRPMNQVASSPRKHGPKVPCVDLTHPSEGELCWKLGWSPICSTLQSHSIAILLDLPICHRCWLNPYSWWLNSHVS